MLAALGYSAREGHCRVPESHVEGTFRFGRDCIDLRRIKDTLPLERRQLLDAIGFVWDPIDGAWSGDLLH